jgi:hypothetical protein
MQNGIKDSKKTRELRGSLYCLTHIADYKWVVIQIKLKYLITVAKLVT